jgi:hypothetical protein
MWIREIGASPYVVVVTAADFGTGRAALHAATEAATSVDLSRAPPLLCPPSCQPSPLRRRPEPRLSLRTVGAGLLRHSVAGRGHVESYHGAALLFHHGPSHGSYSEAAASGVPSPRSCATAPRHGAALGSSPSTVLAPWSWARPTTALALPPRVMEMVNPPLLVEPSTSR